MTPFQVQEFIGDRELIDLCFNPYAAHYHDLNRMMDKFEKWEPPGRGQGPKGGAMTVHWDDEDLPMLNEEDVLFQEVTKSPPPFLKSDDTQATSSYQEDDHEYLSSLGGPFQEGWEWETSSKKPGSGTIGDVPIFREVHSEEF